MNRTARTIFTLAIVTIGITTSASAYTQHIQYPNHTPYDAPLGEVVVRNHGDLEVDLYIDGTIIGRIAPRDRVVIHNVWAGETTVRWEYTWNYDGETQYFDLDNCERQVVDIYPADPNRYQPAYNSYPQQQQQCYPTYQNYPTYPAASYPTYPTYPNHNTVGWDPRNAYSSVTFGDDDFNVTLTDGGLWMNFD